MTQTHEALANRLARIEGQVRALRMALSADAPADCARTLIQVKAASNGLRRFAEAFARAHVDHCLAHGTPSRALARELDEIVSTVFTLS